MSLNIVLYQPDIPQNTGNISRTCAATETTLHLIKPLGFSIDEKQVRRAGLDYWHLLDLHVYENFEEFVEKNNDPVLHLATIHGSKSYADVKFKEDAYIMFGKETAGLPDDILEKYKDTTIRIPMSKKEDARCLNLSNTVAIILYEALRQQDFLDFI